MTNLESLRLSNLPLHGKSLPCLSGLTSLKSLDVDFWNGEWTGSARDKPVSEDCLRAIGTLTQLEWLRLEDYRAGVGVRAGVRNESLVCLINLANLKTLIFDGFVTKDRPMLAHLPPLSRLEALEFSGANIDDEDLARLAPFAHLKSLSVGSPSFYRQPWFTIAGLAGLASVESLEEVRLAYDIAPEHIEALRAIRGLKRLHLCDSVSVSGDDGILVLDDGTELRVRDLDAFRRALGVLRQARPGIVIDTGGNSAFAKPRMGWTANLTAQAIPHRPSSWLPGGDTRWMTPQELADFEKSGGRASFHGATSPDRENKDMITLEF